MSISLVQLNPEVSFNSGSFLFHVIDFTQLAYKMPADKKICILYVLIMLDN